MEREPSTLGVQIRARRKLLGMNERQLAKAAGVSKDVINKLEMGGQATTNSDKAVRIAQALRSSVEDLHSETAATSSLSELLPLSDERLRDLAADAAKQVLTFVREKDLSMEPHDIAQEIAAAFAQMEESERLRARPVIVELGGKVVELRRSGKTA